MNLGPDSQQMLHTYLQYYGKGGSFPVFRGERYQHGSSFRESAQNVGSFALPILTDATKSLISSVTNAREHGKSLKDAIKGALMPTLAQTLEKTGQALKTKIGSGRRRRRRRHHVKGLPKGKKLFGGRIRGRRRRRRRGGAAKKYKRRRHVAKSASLSIPGENF